MKQVKKIRVGIICGGRSAEHEVSLMSARNVLAALDRSKYSPVLIAISKKGQWLLGENEKLLLTEKGGRVTQKGVLALVPGTTPSHVDVVFPVLHGPYGEDGTVQGLLKLLDVPFVGADVLGSAVAMDKDVTKRLLACAGIAVAKSIAITASAPVSFAMAQKKLGKILFIKPANMGSSVGVSKARTKKEFASACARAFEYDNKVIIEECIAGREVECGVLGEVGSERLRASAVGEVIPHHEFYTYEAKYLDENGAALEVPAKLPARVAREVQRVAVAACKALCVQDMARVDCFVTPRMKIVVNEVNTIPGFTSISMYPRLWAESGVPYPALLDILIERAMERHARLAALKVAR